MVQVLQISLKKVMGKKKKRNKSKTPMKKTSWKIIPKLNYKGRKMNLSRGLQDLRHKLK